MALVSKESFCGLGMLRQRMVGLGLVVVVASGAYGYKLYNQRTWYPSGSSDEEVVRQLAQVYWTARREGDLPKAFRYEDPVRQGRGLAWYQGFIGRGVKLSDVNIEEVRLDEEVADVVLTMTYEATAFGRDPYRNTRAYTDDWQKLDGRWYHVLDSRPLRLGKPVIPGTKPQNHGKLAGIFPADAQKSPEGKEEQKN